MWTIYVAVANADLTATLAEKHGATVVTPPRGVPSPLTGEEAGRMAVLVYFAATDTDATAARVAELGGVVSVPPFDTHVGRVSVLNDPDNAVFSVLGPFPAD